ncbi:MAG: hypothetical protein U0350_45645 [Caldilineaceae bacterium]
MFRINRKGYFLLILTLLLCFAGMAVSLAHAQDNSNNRMATSGQMLNEKRLDGWYYQLGRSSTGELELVIELNEHNEQGFGKFRKANEAFASVLFAKYSTIEARVLFTHPLLPNQLPDLVNMLKDQVKAYTLRYKAQTGEATYLIGLRDLSKPASEIADNTAINLSMPGVEYGKGVGKINGFVQLTLSLNKEQYEQLNKDPKVRLIDVAPSYIAMQAGVLEEMAQTGLTLPYAPIDPATDE